MDSIYCNGNTEYTVMEIRKSKILFKDVSSLTSDMQSKEAYRSYQNLNMLLQQKYVLIARSNI